MHPALSIIFFSTLSGAGFGLAAVIGVIGRPDGSSLISAYPLFAPLLIAGTLASIGLLCSVAHLRRPDRAWRAFSQWRSSWLSREGILAIVTLALFAPLAFAKTVDSNSTIAFGFAVFAFSALTVFATSMIYAQIRAVPAWHTWLTPLLYLSFAASGGILSATVLTSAFAWIEPLNDHYQRVRQYNEFNGFALAATFSILTAWFVQSIWWARLTKVGTGKSTIQTATRLEKMGSVRLLEPPHTGPNYLTDEMGFVIARRHATKLRSLSLLFGGLLPIAILVLTTMTQLPIPFDFLLVLPALFLHLFGVGLSRWLFFAEAKHTVSLYY